MHIERGCPPVKVTKVNGKGNQKADWKKVFAGAGTGKEKEYAMMSTSREAYNRRVEMKRIVKPNYHLTTDKDLRAMLSVSLPQTHSSMLTKRRSTACKLLETTKLWYLAYNSGSSFSTPTSIPHIRDHSPPYVPSSTKLKVHAREIEKRAKKMQWRNSGRKRECRNMPRIRRASLSG